MSNKRQFMVQELDPYLLLFTFYISYLTSLY